MKRSCMPAAVSKGFTLVEVLVTVVIFSVGLLGLAGLQATGIKLNHSSLLRSQATLLAYDIVDSMRANQGTSMANLPGYTIGIDDAPPSSPSTQADRDLIDWKGMLSQRLPSGKGSIALNGNRATVVVQWDDVRNPNVAAKSMTVVSDI